MYLHSSPWCIRKLCLPTLHIRLRDTKNNEIGVGVHGFYEF